MTIFLLLYAMFSSFEHNSVRFSGTAQAVSFTLDSDGEIPILAEVSLKELVASPVRSFESSCDAKGNALGSSGLDHPGGTATILPLTRMRLDSVIVPAGTQVYIGFAERRQGLTVVLSYPTLPQQEISGTASGLSAKGSCSFALKLQEPTIELTLQPDDLETVDPLYGQIPINTPLFERSYNVELGRSISSIISGTLSFEEIPNSKFSLDRGSRLSMTLLHGTLGDFRISREGISLLIQGDASRVRLGYRDQRDVIPTKLDWLRTKSQNVELWLGLFSVILILFGFGLPKLGS